VAGVEAEDLQNLNHFTMVVDPPTSRGFRRISPSTKVPIEEWPGRRGMREL
jgi:hypothetical protein